MDRFPLLLEGRPAGELTAEQEALYTRLSARCPLPEGLWCAWVVGEHGELRLGILEPEGRCGAIRRRLSKRLTDPLGRILRGEVRPRSAPARVEASSPGSRPDPPPLPGLHPPPDAWTPAPAPERLFRTPWIRQRLKGRQGVLSAASGLRWLALPWDPRQPFPLPPLFCFARLLSIGPGLYAVFAFDSAERPVF